MLNIKNLSPGDLIVANQLSQTNNRGDKRRIVSISSDGVIECEAVGDTTRPMVGKTVEIRVADGDKSFISHYQFAQWEATNV